MFKYIRTKDGIYETIDYDQLPNNLKKQLDEREHSCMKDYKNIGVFAKMKQGALIISNIQPILLFAIQKQANTIEELCDEFIVCDKGQNNGLPITCPKERLNEIKPYIQIGMQKKFNCWLRGAIWTDKGLIYVAKMNDKGELELL